MRLTRKSGLRGKAGDEFYAVIDTNVIVSALLAKHPDSAPVQVIEQVFDRVIVPMFNDEILSEYKEVLKRPKFLFSEDSVNDMLGAIIELSITLAKRNGVLTE